MATSAPASQHSPRGDDQLIPIALVANEPISRPFAFDVYAVCRQGVVDPDARLNNPCCITLQNAGSPVHGIVQAISASGAVRGLAVVDQFQAYRPVPPTGPEVPDDQSRQPAVSRAPHPAGTAAAGSVTLAAVHGDVARRDARLHQFLESGRNIATGGLGRLPAATG